jgi:pimeloyl-ACP methyl ester carboxylesterase
MHRLTFFVSLVLLLGLFPSAAEEPRRDPGSRGPFNAGSVSVTVTNPDNGHALVTDIYYPAVNGQVDPGNAPYAALVFARGFLASASYYPGNGAHLATWGYITAMPDFPSENIEDRVSDARYMLSYLEAENANPDSIFYRQIAVDRLGVIGHSMGGLTALIVAARDARVKAAVALDPVNASGMAGGPWNYQLEAPNIAAPLAVIGAPAQTCNLFANYNDMYPAAGSDHKAKWVLTDGNHCDFVDTDSALERFACYLVCAGTYSATRVQLVERYTTAWLNYYLRDQTDYYSYLYGQDAQGDIEAGRITRDAQTAPHDVSALPQQNAVELRWRLPAYSVIAGYDIYRSTQSGAYPGAPSAIVGRVSSYLDEDVIGGTPFYYVLRSRDAAGNEHQSSSEVSAVPIAHPTATSTPPAATPTPVVTAKPYRYWLPLLLRESSPQSDGESRGPCNEDRGRRI